MNAMASQVTGLTIVYSTVYSGADQRKHQSSASLAFVRVIRRWQVNSQHNGPVTRKMFGNSAPSHYLNQCWPSSPTHICGTRGRLYSRGVRRLSTHSSLCHWQVHFPSLITSYSPDVNKFISPISLGDMKLYRATWFLFSGRPNGKLEITNAYCQLDPKEQISVKVKSIF